MRTARCLSIRSAISAHSARPPSSGSAGRRFTAPMARFMRISGISASASAGKAYSPNASSDAAARFMAGPGQCDGDQRARGGFPQLVQANGRAERHQLDFVYARVQPERQQQVCAFVRAQRDQRGNQRLSAGQHVDQRQHQRRQRVDAQAHAAHGQRLPSEISFAGSMGVSAARTSRYRRAFSPSPAVPIASPRAMESPIFTEVDWR